MIISNEKIIYHHITTNISLVALFQFNLSFTELYACLNWTCLNGNSLVLTEISAPYLSSFHLTEPDLPGLLKL